MANFITNGLTYEGQNFLEAIIAPMFIGKSPFETQGVRVMTDVTSKKNLFIWGAAKKVLKKYQKGFNASAGSAVSKRTIDVAIMKAEMKEDGMEFYDTVYEILLAKGVDINDVEKSAPEIKNTVKEIFVNAINSDLYRQFWLNDTAKETLSVNNTPSGTADEDYDAYDGIWKLMFDDSAITPTATQIKSFNYSSGAVAQVQTGTLTGTSGTANILINGINYLATFDTDLATTALNFVALHAPALALRNITLTYPGSGVTFVATSSIKGQPVDVITITSVITDLAGTIAQTTANTVPSALSSDQTLGMLKQMYRDSRSELKSIPPAGRVFLLDGYSYENYITTLEDKNSTEQGRIDLINGVEVVTYRGVRVLNLEWENDLLADFPHEAGELPARPYRIIYTAINELVMAVDAVSSTSTFKSWFNMDEEENRYRSTMKTGANYVLPELISVAYEI